jgi:hypothetical protein
MKIAPVILFFIYPAFFISTAFSQQKNLSLNRFTWLQKGNWYEQSEAFTAIKPILESQTIHLSNAGDPQAITRVLEDSIQNANKKKSWIIRKIKIENLIIIKDTTDKFRLTLDPLFNFEYGKDLADSSKSFYKNTRGVLIRGDIGSAFSFESSFYENQATYVNYIRNYNNASLVVPGQGRWKQFKNNGYDFAMASGYVSYSPNHHFNFQIGTGKHFVGDGYRSLLLSDNAFNYPFARITSSFGKFQYTNLYASLMNLSDAGVKTPPGTERLFQKKAGNFQFLSWNIHKRVQWGFFQGLIWQASDSLNRQCLKLPYASPLIYSALLSEGLRGKNNVVLGSTFKLKITSSLSLYGQYMMDDFSTEINSIHNKAGFQAGVKYFDVFKIKNLHLQMEYNQVRPYSYAHSTSAQSYTHYNQPLAHPLGANFKEEVVFLNYSRGDFFTEIKVNYAIIGKDSIGKNYGNTIFSSDNNSLYGPNSTINKMGQGVKTTLRILDFQVGYVVNKVTNFNIILGILNRTSISSVEDTHTNFIYFGIRTSLTNVYYDF